MQFVDIGNEGLSNRKGSVWMAETYKVGIFGQFVDNDQDGVKVLGLG